MKKFFPVLAACLLGLSALHARVVTSVASGNFTNPATWDCACVPVNGDTIVIDQTVSLDVNLSISAGGIHVNAGSYFIDNLNNKTLNIAGGFFYNEGTVNARVFIVSGTATAISEGPMTTREIRLEQNAAFSSYAYCSSMDSMIIGVNATFDNYLTSDHNIVVNDGTFTNHASLLIGDLYNQGSFNSQTSMGITRNCYNTGTVMFSAFTGVGQDVWNAGNFTIDSTVLVRSFYNEDTAAFNANLICNGGISVDNDFLNADDMSGSGKICVGGSSVNSGSVNGTLDICDASNGSWDQNTGTEAVTVTHCANGPCTVGIAEQTAVGMTMVPNPAYELVKIQLPDAEAGVVEVIDVTGRVIMREDIAGKEVVLNVLQLPEGIYSVVVRGDATIYSGTFIKE